MKLQIFQELPEAAMTIRRTVFVEEQGCPHVWMEKIFQVIPRVLWASRGYDIMK